MNETAKPRGEENLRWADQVLAALAAIAPTRPAIRKAAALKLAAVPDELAPEERDAVNSVFTSDQVEQVGPDLFRASVSGQIEITEKVDMAIVTETVEDRIPAVLGLDF